MVKKNTLNENSLRQMIRDAIEEMMVGADDLQKIDAAEEELDEMTTTANVAGYQTPAAFVGKGGKQRKNRWHKTVTDRLGYETVWDEEDATELGPNAKKRSNYVGTNEQINESINESKPIVSKKDLQSFVNRKLKMHVPVSIIKKIIIPTFGLQSIEIVKGKVKNFVTETTQAADTDFADLSGKELFTGENDFSKKNSWVNLVAELTGFEVLGYGEAPDKFIVQGDPQTVKGKMQKLYELTQGDNQDFGNFAAKRPFKGTGDALTEGRRGEYQIYRDDDSLTAHQKIGESIKRIRRNLKELKKEVNLNLRLKNESGVESDAYWKRTRTDLNKISEHLFALQEKIRRF